MVKKDIWLRIVYHFGHFVYLLQLVVCVGVVTAVPNGYDVSRPSGSSSLLSAATSLQSRTSPLRPAASSRFPSSLVSNTSPLIPAPSSRVPVVPILVDEREGPDAFGNYNFYFETGDGISRQEEGAPLGPEGAVAAQGGWS